MAEPDGGLALVAVLAAGPRRLERAHVALRHELVVVHPQVVLVPALVILLLAAAFSAAGAMRARRRGGDDREGEGGEAERRKKASVPEELWTDARG